VHGDGLLDDEAILEELADGVAAVGIGELVRLVRVHPDLALTAPGDGRCEALLSREVHPTESHWVSDTVRHRVNGAESVRESSQYWGLCRSQPDGDNVV